MRSREVWQLAQGHVARVTESGIEHTSLDFQPCIAWRLCTRALEIGSLICNRSSAIAVKSWAAYLSAFFPCKVEIIIIPTSQVVTMRIK